MKKLISLATCVMAVFFLASAASAIPDEEIYNFRTSATAIFPFDDYRLTYDGVHNILRQIEIYTFFNQSQYYYVIVRASDADQPPYDDFFITFVCDSDPALSFHTTDYISWVQSGQISFKRTFSWITQIQVGNITLNASRAICQVSEATNLTINGNTGYTTFKLDLVPTTITAVPTIESYCEEDALEDTITAELSAIDTIFTANVGFFSTLFIVFQIIAIVFVVLAIPIMIFMLIKWVIYKVTGHRILERREYT